MTNHTFIFVGFVLCEILKQVFWHWERTAGYQFFYSVDSEIWGWTRETFMQMRDKITAFQCVFYWALHSTYPTVMTSPEFLSVTKLLAMVMMTGSMICRYKSNELVSTLKVQDWLNKYFVF